MVNDDQLFRVLQQAGRTGALVMVHAENGDAVDLYSSEAIAAGDTAPRFHATTRPPEVEGEATARAIRLAHWAGQPLFVVHVTCEEAVREIQAARDRGEPVVRRDLHPVPVPHGRRARAARLRGREVRLLAAPARGPHQRHPLRRPAPGGAAGHLDRPLPVQLRGPEGARQGRLPADPERHAGDRVPPLAALRPRGAHREALAHRARAAHERGARASSSASRRARGRSRPARTPTS